MAIGLIHLLCKHMSSYNMNNLISSEELELEFEYCNWDNSQ